MKVVAIVQARTTSERFPLKIFAGLLGRPMLAHVLERAAAIQGVDQVVLAVPENDVRLVSHLWPHVYGGSEKDVLERYADVACEFNADIIIRITGDTPLLAPDLVSSFLQSWQGSYTAICQPYSDIADGWDAEIFSSSELMDAAIYAVRNQREHVTTFMREKGDAKVISVEGNPEWRKLKCSVDTREDLQRVQKIMDCLEDKTDFSHHATWKAWERAGRP